jgi:DNA invertase Pin-like site-specific DNA recombinase
MDEIPSQNGLSTMPALAPTKASLLERLRAAGCSRRNIFREKVTGARADRRELDQMLGKLAPQPGGNLVTVARIDRPPRSTFDLFGIIKRTVDAKAQFRSLAEPWADTAPASAA